MGHHTTTTPARPPKHARTPSFFPLPSAVPRSHQDVPKCVTVTPCFQVARDLPITGERERERGVWMAKEGEHGEGGNPKKKVQHTSTLFFVVGQGKNIHPPPQRQFSRPGSLGLTSPEETACQSWSSRMTFTILFLPLSKQCSFEKVGLPNPPPA